MAVLLSIKPKYVDEIKSETKKYEFRKKIFKKRNISTAYIYSTNPVKKLVGKFTIGEIIEDHPNILWDNLNMYAGIEKEDFFDYFNNKKTGFAIEITEMEFFDEPIEPKKIINNFVPPQSFYYIEEDIIPDTKPDSIQKKLDGYCNSRKKLASK